MIRSAILVVLQFGFLLSTAYCQVADPISPKQAPSLKIGVILPLTGRAQTIGNSIWSGIELGRNTLTPEQREHLELILEDDASQVNQAISAFRKLIDGGANIVFSAMSNTGNALAPLAEQAGIPLISFAFDSKISKDKKYVTNMYTGVEDAAQQAIEECKRRGITKIAIVMTQHEGNVAMRDSFLKAAPARFEIVAKEEFLPGDMDFHMGIMKLRKISNLQIIANFLHPAQAGVFARQARELGLKTPMFSLGSFEDRGVLESAQGALEGQWFVGVDYADDFLVNLHKSFPNVSEFGANNGLDAVLVIRNLIGKKVSREEIMSEIRSPVHRTGGAKDFWYSGTGAFKFQLKIKVVSGSLVRNE